MKMRHEVGEGESIVFEEIEQFFVDLFHRIPASADPGRDPAANERLFSSPVTEEDDDDFNGDWREFVEPEIRELFESATQIVEKDLRSLPQAEPGAPKNDFVLDPTLFVAADGVLEVPRKHIDAWLTTLNRARLVIAAKHGFGEDEMDEEIEFPPLSTRDISLFQIHFYDFLQQIMLRELGFD